MSEQCRTEHVTINGKERTFVVRGPRPLDDTDRQALSVLVTAAERHAAEHHPHLGICQDLVRAVRAAVACIPDGPIDTILHVGDGATVKTQLRDAMRAVVNALSPQPASETSIPEKESTGGP